jgi:hypothetical protein
MPNINPQSSFDTHQRRLGASLTDLLQSPIQNSNAPTGISPANTHSPAHSLKYTALRSSASPKRRRLHLNPPLHAADPSSIVVADMQNESDALHILALAGQGRLESTAHKQPTKSLREYPLVKLGIVTELQVLNLSEVFFRCHHHLYVSALTNTLMIANGPICDHSEKP